MNLLIVLHSRLLPFFLDSLPDIRAQDKDSGRPWLSPRRQLAWELDTPGPALLPCHRHLRLRAPLPQTTHKAGSPWHSIFYFLKLYTNVKYFNSESMGKLFGFKLL